MGVNLLRRSGIPTIIVTKEKTKIVRRWAKKMNIEHVYDGIQDKESIAPIIMKKYSVKISEIGYIGDDINDIGLLKKVGFSACPNDGIEQVRSIVNYVCEKKGGEGVFREVADIFLRHNS